ncbi:MAG: hypothetical protein ACOYMZ_01575 [Minisyncoccia bacterium]
MRKKSRYLRALLAQQSVRRIHSKHYATASLVIALLVGVYVFTPIGTTAIEQRLIIAVPFAILSLVFYWYSEKKRGYRLGE